MKKRKTYTKEFLIQSRFSSSLIGFRSPLENIREIDSNKTISTIPVRLSHNFHRGCPELSLTLRVYLARVDTYI